MDGISAEACCKHIVHVAQHEVDANPSSSRAMRDFSNIREEDAERGARKVLLKHGLTAPVAISEINLDDAGKLPWVKPSSWFEHLLKIGALEKQMAGVPSLEKMKGVLSEFWSRYKSIDNGHPVYALEREGVLTLDCLVPYLSHSDEGRTVRDLPLWVFNIHGIIGRGTLAYLQTNQHRLPVSENPQGLNYIGNTWANHFLVATMMKDVSSPGAISQLLRAFATDAETLLHQGISYGNGRDRIHFIHLATKGDLPALSKIGRFLRTFGHAPRASKTKTPCQGICWKCLGGQERDVRHHKVAVPYEDVSETPAWENTLHTTLPWLERPSLLEGLALDDGRAINFFQTDFFHNAHLGCLKSFASSALVSMVEAEPPLSCMVGLGSVEKRFEALTALYKSFFATRRTKPWVAELSRDVVCWLQSSATPAAKWNKGAASTQIMCFIGWFCDQFLSTTDDPVMKSIAVRLQ